MWLRVSCMEVKVRRELSLLLKKSRVGASGPHMCTPVGLGTSLNVVPRPGITSSDCWLLTKALIGRLDSIWSVIGLGDGRARS